MNVQLDLMLSFFRSTIHNELLFRLGLAEDEIFDPNVAIPDLLSLVCQRHSVCSKDLTKLAFHASVDLLLYIKFTSLYIWTPIDIV